MNDLDTEWGRGVAGPIKSPGANGIGTWSQSYHRCPVAAERTIERRLRVDDVGRRFTDNSVWCHRKVDLLDAGSIRLRVDRRAADLQAIIISRGSVLGGSYSH